MEQVTISHEQTSASLPVSQEAKDSVTIPVTVPISRSCKTCEKPLGSRPNKKFCNNACRQANYRAISDAREVRICEACEKPIQSSSPNKKFCNNACKQTHYRAKSSARAANLQGLRNQRLNRRREWIRRKLRHRYLGKLGYEGPEANGVPTVTALDLHRFSKEVVG
jgi:hypothetical protein